MATIKREDLGRTNFSDVSGRGRLLDIHPGEILNEDFLGPLGVSQYRLAPGALLRNHRRILGQPANAIRSAPGGKIPAPNRGQDRAAGTGSLSASRAQFRSRAGDHPPRRAQQQHQ